MCYINLNFYVPYYNYCPCYYHYYYTVSQKNIPDIVACNLKTNYQILMASCVRNICTKNYQMTVQLPTSPNVCFCTT